MRFDQFLAQPDEELDPDEEVDPAAIVRAWRRPDTAIAEAPSDWRQKTRGGGSPMLSTVTGRDDAAAVANGVTDQAPNRALATAQRIEIARWGTEGPDDDRVTPQELEAPNEEPRSPGEKMLSNTDAPPVKPPGPDSPSPQYKDPAASFLSGSGYDAKKKAYDEDWDASGKYKKFKIETTQQRVARREQQQRDVFLSREQGLEDYKRSLGEKPHAMGTHDVRTADGKKQTFLVMSDGSSKLMLEGLDDLAHKKSPYLSETIQWDGATGHGFKQKMSGEWEAQTVPAPGAPADNGMIGPTGADNRNPMHRWMAPQRNAELSYGERLVDAEGNLLAEGGDRPVSAGRGGSGSGGGGTTGRRRKGDLNDMQWGGITVPGDIYGEALSSAEAEAKKDMERIREKDEGKSSEKALQDWEDNLVDEKMRKKLARRGYRPKGPDGASGSSAGGKKVVQVNKPKQV